MKRFLIPLACLVLSTNAFADAKDELVRRVLIVTKARETHERSMEAIYQRKPVIPEGASADEKPAYEKARQRMNEIYRTKLSWEALEPACARIYKVRFTEDELKALAEFYESSIGKSIAAKTPDVSRLCSQVTVTEIQKVVPLYQQYLAEELTAVYMKRTPSPDRNSK